MTQPRVWSEKGIYRKQLQKKCNNCGRTVSESDGKEGSDSFVGEFYCNPCWSDWDKQEEEKRAQSKKHVPQKAETSKAAGGASPSAANASLSSVPLVSGTSSSTRTVFILRHGSRPDNAEDPYLDSLGRKEAEQVAIYFADLVREREPRIGAIFSSPYRRALETAVPVAEALNVSIRIEYGFCELLVHRHTHNSDPIPTLQGRTSDQLPGYSCTDWMYNSAVVPEYPDAEGPMRPGGIRQRQKALERHRRAVNAALAAAPPGTSILVVGHGCTHDFVADALSPDQHLKENHTGNHHALVPHCAITELCEVPHQANWDLQAYGHTPWKHHVRPGSTMLGHTPRKVEERHDVPAPAEKVQAAAEGNTTAFSSSETLINIIAALQERHQPCALAACKAKGESFPHVQTAHGHTLLHLAAMAQPSSGEAAVDSASALLNARAVVNACNDHGETPLLLALRAAAELRALADAHPNNGDGLELVRLLLERRADSNATDPPSGETALMEAADYGDFTMCRLLLDFRADPLRRSVKGLTARHLAEAASCNGPVAQLLQETEATMLAGP